MQKYKWLSKIDFSFVTTPFGERYQSKFQIGKVCIETQHNNGPSISFDLKINKNGRSKTINFSHFIDVEHVLDLIAIAEDVDDITEVEKNK